MPRAKRRFNCKTVNACDKAVAGQRGGPCSNLDQTKVAAPSLAAAGYACVRVCAVPSAEKNVGVLVSLYNNVRL